MQTSDIDQVIEYYLSELSPLKQLLKEDLEGADYEAASLHQKAIEFTRDRLLKN